MDCGCQSIACSLALPRPNATSVTRRGRQRSAERRTGVVPCQWTIAMKAGLPVKPTKTHKGENFPVASLLIAPKHRAAILAYYRFARGADDVADNPTLTPDDK